MFRQARQWWREALFIGAALAVGMALLRILSEYREAELKAQPFEITSGTIQEVRAGGSRHFPDGPYMRVVLPDGTVRYLSIGDRDYRGCLPGSRVALERRGTHYSLGRTMCRNAEAGVR